MLTQLENIVDTKSDVVPKSKHRGIFKVLAVVVLLALAAFAVFVLFFSEDFKFDDGLGGGDDGEGGDEGEEEEDNTIPLEPFLFANPQDSLLARVNGGAVNGSKFAYFGAKKNFFGIPIDIDNLITTDVDLDNAPLDVDVNTDFVRTKFRQATKLQQSATLISQAYSGTTALTFDWELNNVSEAVAFRMSVGVGSVVLALDSVPVDVDTVNNFPSFSSAVFNFTCDEFRSIPVNAGDDISEMFSFALTEDSNNTQVVRPSLDFGGGSHVFFLPQCDAPVDEEGFANELGTQTGRLIDFTCRHLNYISTVFADGFFDEVIEIVTNNTDEVAANQTEEDIMSILESWESTCRPDEFVDLVPNVDERKLQTSEVKDFINNFANNSAIPLGELREKIFEELTVTLVTAAKTVLRLPGVTTFSQVALAAVEVQQSCTPGVGNSIDFSEIFGDGTPNGPLPQPCNGLSLAGNDQPDTRTTDLGNLVTSFDFKFETFRIRDQMRIRHGPNLIFDSGCVGTEGNRFAEVMLSDFPSTIIEVEVIPNCAGSSGTAWNYLVQCPDNALLTCENLFIGQVEPDSICECLVSNGSRVPPTQLISTNDVEFTGCNTDTKPLPCGLPAEAFAPSYAEDFQQACIDHDVCYATCGVNRRSCDDFFCNEQLNACNGLSFTERFLCQSQANVNCEAARYGGAEAYIAAQNQFCTCG